MKHFELGIKRKKTITNPEKGCWADYCYTNDNDNSCYALAADICFNEDTAACVVGYDMCGGSDTTTGCTGMDVCSTTDAGDPCSVADFCSCDGDSPTPFCWTDIAC